MSSDNPGSLVSCEWLKNHLDKNSPNLVVVDVTWASTKNCHENYAREHIPGAVFINMMDAEHSQLFPRNIPTPECFQKIARSAGINKDSHVIIYSDSHTFGFFCSGRGWWSFRIFGHSNVSVLNGGLVRWKSCAFPTTDAVSPVKEGDFVSTWNKSLYCTFEDVLRNLKCKDFQLCDSRPFPAYSGVNSPGHITGAYNLPFTSLMNEEKMELKSVDEMKEVFSKAGIDVNMPVVAHCNSGMSSCNVVLAALLCGSPRVALYHGGFTEWKKLAPDYIEK